MQQLFNTGLLRSAACGRTGAEAERVGEEEAPWRNCQVQQCHPGRHNHLSYGVTLRGVLSLPFVLLFAKLVLQSSNP